MKHWLLCLITLLASSASLAVDSFSFAGCSDAEGKPVATRADPALNWIAQARQEEDGTYLIAYNPTALPDMLPEARLFLFAHECARIALGQPLSTQRSFEEIRAADCWALNTLERSRLIPGPATLDAIEMELAADSEAWQLVPQPTHELYLTSCPRTRGSVRESLDLPAAGKPHRDNWNACVQSCGATLYRCGRSSSCMSRYDSCVAACGKK